MITRYLICAAISYTVLATFEYQALVRYSEKIRPSLEEAIALARKAPPRSGKNIYTPHCELLKSFLGYKWALCAEVDIVPPNCTEPISVFYYQPPSFLYGSFFQAMRGTTQLEN